MSKIGVLLINLGTPDSCEPKSVRRYLKQFLTDPRVIDIPKLLRMILIHWIVIPFRYKKSAHAYQKIWFKSGSPLLINSLAIVNALQYKLKENFHVELGMRYGNPSIASAIQKLSACKKIIVIPLFPQYSSAATGSAIEECLNNLKGLWNIPSISIKNDFYADPDFIKAYTNIIQQNLMGKSFDKIIFSYHGLPERHLNKSACAANCSRLNACPNVHDNNAYCYRAQCYETSRLLAKELGLENHQYIVSFQSRLGRTPWIKPYTDIVLPELIKENQKNIAIVCPSFVADCLETLEEINLRAREDWKKLGGGEFTFIPCINDDSLWIKGLEKMVKSMVINHIFQNKL